jgi:CheY-like chemotaxis protein
MKPPSPPKILIVGNDTALTYLVGRYAERSGYDMVAAPSVSSAEEICKQQPAAIFFPSIESLEAAQSLVVALTNDDIPILVCSSAADEMRAYELGADYCLLHPLTYDGFMAALVAAKVSRQSPNPPT